MLESTKYKCSGCGKEITLAPCVTSFVCRCSVASDNPVKFSTLWAKLHAYPFSGAWSPEAAREWFARWLNLVPMAGCSCRSNFAAYLEANPPSFATAADFFAWTVTAHNYVSTNHVKPPKPAISLAEAYEIYSAD